ncbi:MAG: DUF2273 domain-containing protein [Clostridia bacterium]|nr:DUF2273 domain-containing protein [Clostridia bacterium]
MNLKKGTPAYGLLLGGVLTLVGALVMIIGFWKTLVLCLLFGLGYFLGTVENKREFMKTTANKLIPDKEVKVIDLKSELLREQELSQAAAEKADSAETNTKE